MSAICTCRSGKAAHRSHGLVLHFFDAVQDKTVLAIQLNVIGINIIDAAEHLVVIDKLPKALQICAQRICICDLNRPERFLMGMQGIRPFKADHAFSSSHTVSSSLRADLTYRKLPLCRIAQHGLITGPRPRHHLTLDLIAVAQIFLRDNPTPIHPVDIALAEVHIGPFFKHRIDRPDRCYWLLLQRKSHCWS